MPIRASFVAAMTGMPVSVDLDNPLTATPHEAAGGSADGASDPANSRTGPRCIHLASYDEYRSAIQAFAPRQTAGGVSEEDWAWHFGDSALATQFDRAVHAFFAQLAARDGSSFMLVTDGSGARLAQIEIRAGDWALPAVIWATSGRRPDADDGGRDWRAAA